jgi:prolyl oligopeptidase
VSTNAGLERLEGDDLFFVSVSFVTPPRGLVLRAGSGALEVTSVNTIPPLADFSDAEVRVESAVSKDGARIPMYILQRKGTRLDGTNPVLLTGYGGYGVNTQPFYRDTGHVLLEQGVVQVRTALRGGGEFGDAWHLAGNLVNKQNVFDDFIACAERLVALGYTTPARLAIEGGSNGGLLMGAALTQRPELFRAVVSHVGLYDMIRVENEPNGAFNVTEFGTVKDPAQFRALLGYSPYHHVRDGVAYPAILFLTGANDPRVDPAHSRKMTARLQAANPAGRPVLLRTSGNTGHGMGSPVKERIAQAVDVDLFLLQALGVTLTPPPTSAAH